MIKPEDKLQVKINRLKGLFFDSLDQKAFDIFVPPLGQTLWGEFRHIVPTTIQTRIIKRTFA